MDYNKHYNLLITKARGRSILPFVYSEKHHIIPKSMGGSNDSDNLVKLLPEEHLIAHLLLAKIHGGGMWAAANMMISRIHNNKEYRWVREAYSKSKKGKPTWNKGLKLSEAHKVKLRKPKSAETKLNMSKAKTNYIPWNAGLIGCYLRSDSTKDILSRLKMNVPRKSYKYYTPNGVFYSTASAALHNCLSSHILLKYCDSEEYSDWYRVVL